ncbi:MAG: LysR family transcriptional regulator [Deltaproteobacteria bacterium]|nr:LysR family transcriptional regulator [Deltaproteobacteria bacterium]
MKASSIAALADRRITLEHLRAFVAVAETGSFQSAGREIYRSQSAVTQSLQKLEEYLNCQLLERRQGHVLGLTKPGVRLLPEVKEILGRLDNVVGNLQRPELKGHIALGIPDSFNTNQIQSAVARCTSMNKELKVQVTAGLSADLAEKLEQGLLDVVILQQHCNYAAPHCPSYQHVLLEERLHWVTDNWDNYRHLDELPLITFSEGCTSYRSAALEALAKAEKPYYFSFVSGSYESIRKAISSGFGVGVLPESEVGEKHVILTAEEGFPELPIVYVLLQTKSESRVIRQFCDMLKSLPDFSRKQRLDSQPKSGPYAALA